MDRNFGPDKSWGEMSQSEKRAYIIRNRQRGEFERLAGNGQVLFLDELTPLLDSSDPHRRCIYAGNILENGIDETGRYWTKLRITAHKLQLQSEEHCMPGFIVYYESVLRPLLQDSNQSNRSKALAELEDIHRRYPDTDKFIDLELPKEPMRFYIDDLTDCEFYASS